MKNGIDNKTRLCERPQLGPYAGEEIHIKPCWWRWLKHESVYTLPPVTINNWGFHRLLTLLSLAKACGWPAKTKTIWK
ncbi:hypothetical protein KCP74_12430 [Salmonella enterica subsp. enterica]|nr:hypothetical protein KCP74_12430 [Salmonella enterica subsp. enterica]